MRDGRVSERRRGEGVCDAQYERRGGDAVELEGVERGPAGGALHGGHVVCGGGGR